MKSASLRASQAQEKRLAARYDGAVNAASGAFWSRKGDVTTDEFLIEAKTTSKKSFSVTETVISKIEREALTDSKTWLLFVELPGREVVVMDADDFHALFERART